MSLSTMLRASPWPSRSMDGTVMVNNAKVVKADIICSNGVIHWIDKVLMPPAAGMSMPGM